MAVKITEPGKYPDIPLEVYHGDCCDGHSVSSTILRAMEEHCPRKAWFNSYLNSNRPAKKDEHHFSLGSAMADLFSSGELSAKRFALSPYPEFRTNEAKAWKRQALKDGKYILKKDDLTTLIGMRDALFEEPLIKQGILAGDVENSIFHKDKETGLWIKARPDTIPADQFLGDYKSTADAGKRSIERSIYSYWYNMQLGLSGEVIENALGQKIENYVLIFQEKTPPYLVSIVELSEDYIAHGRVQNRKAIRRFADCLDKDYWPGYDLGEPTIHTPKWLSERIEEEQKSGLAPSFLEAGVKVRSA